VQNASAHPSHFTLIIDRWPCSSLGTIQNLLGSRSRINPRRQLLQQVTKLG
jgi:hypothetical protein